MRQPQCPQETIDDWAATLQRVAKHQDKAAFTRLFRHFAPRIKAYGIALSSIHTSPEMADELVQEVMIKVWQKAPYFDSAKANASTWIFAIARNCRIDYLRKMKRTEYQLRVEDLWPISEDLDPFTTLHYLRSEQDIQSVVNDMPKEQAVILREIYVEGKTHSEVAAQSGLPLGTVKSRIRLAIDKLRNALGTNEPENDGPGYS